ncbi:hypothetical protein BO86DRAFT_17111 [Aspergillus japonicus CBS 114.51]|uniref:Uncharacterized protein n=1 Tax=Aspergillus japonicus CBS 114.51 TaxID=1448312 RepID=A0A8T8WKV1_ASPJA|nr:hypothetical protein BO86DRAFT_17111 [Aspergillus japonicus CBS 114.51]RAH76376.1 hypothetical protein BO86DRAFT_17111 [Aspergillus japonicus CBS 114.51]
MQYRGLIMFSVTVEMRRQISINRMEHEISCNATTEYRQWRESGQDRRSSGNVLVSSLSLWDEHDHKDRDPRFTTSASGLLLSSDCLSAWCQQHTTKSRRHFDRSLRPGRNHPTCHSFTDLPVLFPNHDEPQLEKCEWSGCCAGSRVSLPVVPRNPINPVLSRSLAPLTHSLTHSSNTASASASTFP